MMCVFACGVATMVVVVLLSYVYQKLNLTLCKEGCHLHP